MNCKILFLLIFWPCFLQGQNLLINGGFDSLSSCPLNQGDIQLAVGWKGNSTLLPGSPDLFNTCAFQGGLGTPLSFFGYQQPKNGGGYVGMYCYAAQGPNAREFFQSQFQYPMINNEEYYIEFWCCLAEGYNIGIRNLGAYISTDADSINTLDLSLYNPQVVNSLSNVLGDTMNWMKISAIYKSTGSEEYITIGNFYPDSLTVVDTVFNVSAFYNFPYYLIDAVSVIPVDSLTSIKENKEFNFETYPNPTNDILNINLGNNGAANCKFSLYSLEGQLLYIKEEPISILTQIDMRRFSKGVYILEVKTDKGSSVKKIVKE